MSVLLTGGSGLMGTFDRPELSEHPELRALDPRPPEHADLVEYVEGSITDLDAVARALDGVDTFINLVMRYPQDGRDTDQDVPTITTNNEVNTLGLHLLLWTAQAQSHRYLEDGEAAATLPTPATAAVPKTIGSPDAARAMPPTTHRTMTLAV